MHELCLNTTSKNNSFVKAMLVKLSCVILVWLLILKSMGSLNMNKGKNSTFWTKKYEGRKRGSNLLEGKILGGTPVPIEKFPSAVVLYNYGRMCAGTILNAWAVMTASHCFVFNDDVDEMAVHVGATLIHDANATLHSVLVIERHPQYGKPLTFSCDIALVFLASPIKFGPKAKKAVLATSGKWMREEETNFVVTGWGWTKYNGKTSDKGLLMTKLRFIANWRCSSWHNSPISEDMFCLYGDAERDACKGDSGGGVLWNGQIVGIVSHGDHCAERNKPSVYTNVWYFLPWIRKTMNNYEERYCHTR